MARQYSRNDSTSIFSCSGPESFRGRIFSCCSSSTTLTNARSENADQLRDRHAFLFHRIAVAQCDRVLKRAIFFAERLEIDRHAKWRADFVLAPVTPPDS